VYVYVDYIDIITLHLTTGTGETNNDILIGQCLLFFLRIWKQSFT